jgi:hypothetical protein
LLNASGTALYNYTQIVGINTTAAPDADASGDADGTMSDGDADGDANGTMCAGLGRFSVKYKDMHGYICLVICIFGAIANLLNIIVLTRKEMNGSPINRILTGMSSNLVQARTTNI